jgi:Rrf2 family protein
VKFSTRGRYAIRASMCLASKYGQGPVSLKKISENQGISAKYLENIMRLLVNAGIAYSTKGKNGGFILSRDPGSIKVGEILKVTEGSLMPVACVETCDVCKKSELCASRDMWTGLGRAVTDYLNSVTIGDMARAQLEKYEKAGKKAPCL